MTESTKEPAPSKLMRQIRWALVAIAVVTLAIISGRAPDVDTSGGAAGDPQRCAVTVTADVLNVRAGPGTGHATVDRLARNAVVDAQRETSGGFRKLADGRWAAEEFVRPSAGCTAP